MQTCCDNVNVKLESSSHSVRSSQWNLLVLRLPTISFYISIWIWADYKLLTHFGEHLCSIGRTKDGS